MNEFKVGLLAISTIVAVIYMSMRVTSNQSGFGEYVPYKTILSDASGIFPKTPIKIAGINAGRIKAIELQGNQALIHFEVLKRIKITTKSKLRVKSVGFLGDKYLEILISDSKTRLPENHLLDSEVGGGLEVLAKGASELLDETKGLVKGLREAIAPIDGESPIKGMLKEFGEMSKNANTTMTSLRNLISGNEDKINKLISDFSGVAQKMNMHMDSKKKGSVLNDLKDVLASTKDMMTNMNAIVADIRKGKGTMGKFLVEEQIADEIKETLASVKKIVSKVDSIRTELEVFTGADTEAGGKTEAGLRIFPSPERFYLIGISTSKFGPVKENETTTVEGGVSRTVIRRDKEKNSFKYNVQLGRVVHNWTFRGGLIESAGGIGIDYSLDNNKWVFSSEIFDYREDIGINFRLAAQVHLWNVMYGKISFNDIIQDSRSLTGYVGLKFSDEDLKSILGFFL